MYTIEQLIKKLRDLSVYTGDADDTIFKMGQIHALCEEYSVPNKIIFTDQETIYVDKDKKVVESLLPEKESPKKSNSFEKFVEEQKNKQDSDDKILSLLERNGEHMNLKFELSKRYPNKSYLKTVTGILNDMGINTMSDFLVKMDNIEFFQPFVSYMSYISEDLNKKYKISRLSSNDRNKLCQLYLTANEKENKTYDDVMKDFLELGPNRETRFMNSMKRATAIHTINQLYSYLDNLDDLSDMKKLKGMSNLPTPIHALYDKLHN